MYNIIYNIKAGHSEKTKKSCHSESVFLGRFEIYTLASTPSKLAVLHGSRKKILRLHLRNPVLEAPCSISGGFYWKRLCLSAGHGYGNAGTSQVSKSDDTGSPRIHQNPVFLVSVVGSMIFNTPRGVDQISPIDSFCYWLVAKTFQK